MSPELHDYSEAELLQALRDKQRINIKKKASFEMLPTEVIKEKLYQTLVEFIRLEVEEMITGENKEDGDTAVQVWEIVIQGFYGEDIFDKIYLD